MKAFIIPERSSERRANGTASDEIRQYEYSFTFQGASRSEDKGPQVKGVVCHSSSRPQSCSWNLKRGRANEKTKDSGCQSVKLESSLEESHSLLLRFFVSSS